ncbi:hypothetical protein LPB140_04795 [Sphingorhabdus lutea]|uniref:histidine kinase n=1 Tax=Sphingorhabdus lutea TaxID=1913578 RepID=A0A1L3JAR1_9SPHN|nr:HAMP domain-containing sensor histidine kinase [Sphingorhabdus lutea]APG62230.1 hypothetical protein LPB140_04795 [Sphingorhabdus lutea]
MMQPRKFFTKLWPKSLSGQILMMAAIALFLAQLINAILLIQATKARQYGDAAAILIGRLDRQLSRDFMENAAPNLTPTAGEFGQGQRRNNRRRNDNIQRRFGVIDIGTKPVPIKAAYNYREELSSRAYDYLMMGPVKFSSVKIYIAPTGQLPDNLSQRLKERDNNLVNPRNPNNIPKEAIILVAQTRDNIWISGAQIVREPPNNAILILLGQTLLLYLLVLIPLALIMRKISRPLTQLTKGVSAFSGHELPQPIPAEGPQDIRSLIDAVNDMQARMSALLSEKDMMLGAIGHDLKTPLASMRVRLESADEPAERAKIEQSIIEMDLMLDDILMLARMGHSAEPAKLVNLSAFLEHIVDEYALLDHPVNIDEIPRHVKIYVRPNLLRRAIRNLIDNALKYGVQANIALQQMSNNDVEIFIDDMGNGINEADIDAMFNPFTRAEKSRNKAQGGAGLGLTISKSIIELDGGKLSLSNRKEGGLRAAIYLPHIIPAA